jgi:phage head maturation protease
MRYRKSVELPPFGRSTEIRSSSFEEATNSVEIIWTTGAAVRRYDWREGQFYDEELVVTPGAVRLDRLNSGAPFLDTHDDLTLAAVIGTVVPGTAEIRSGRGIARVALSVAPGHAGIIANIKAGVIRSISVGYRVHSVEKIEVDGQTPIWRVIDWEPLELSAVPVPADAGAFIRSEKRDDSDRMRLAPCHFLPARPNLTGAAAAAYSRMNMRSRAAGLL